MHSVGDWRTPLYGFVGRQQSAVCAVLIHTWTLSSYGLYIVYIPSVFGVLITAVYLVDEGIIFDLLSLITSRLFCALVLCHMHDTSWRLSELSYPMFESSLAAAAGVIR